MHARWTAGSEKRNILLKDRSAIIFILHVRCQCHAMWHSMEQEIYTKSRVAAFDNITA
jgi:hypothetical protein